jgi:hypothetical protein
MKILKASSLLILIATLFFSCQKEYSLENPTTAAGTWQFNDSTTLYTGNIDTASIVVNGPTKTMNLEGRSADGKQTFILNLYTIDSFTVGSSYKASLSQADFQYFNQSKTIYAADQSVGEFIVNISAISNSSVTGTFSGLSEDSTGALKQITLGKFTARINLAGNGTGTGGSGSASGTLGVSAGSCTPYTPSGTYTQGVTLTSANTVGVTVTVTTPGTYIITTNTVNGVSFSSSGTFTTTGTQNVTLNGSGTPVSAGAQNFAVTFGASTCNFSLTFGAGTPQPTGDYFPATVGLSWTYKLQGGTSADTFQIKVNNNLANAGGNSYSIFSDDNVPPDSSYYRKASVTGGKDYFEYINTQSYFGFDAPGTPTNTEYTFLKDYVAQGTTWQSGNITGTQSGTSFTIYIKMTLTAKDVTATSGVVTSNYVDKVKYEYFLTTSPSTPFYIEERWFARGIGLIYNSLNDGTKTDVYLIGRY